MSSAWVIMMALVRYKFAALTGSPDAMSSASGIWATLIKTTGTTSGYTTISLPVLGCLVFAWILIYSCIRNGPNTVGKVVKYTVFLPIFCLLILAIKGIIRFIVKLIEKNLEKKGFKPDEDEWIDETES
jgi:NSS family neurotransmitter:Na+ symporter